MTEAIKARAGTQAVERAFAVLKAVAAENSAGATLMDVTRAVGLNRTTVYRLLKCLVDQGAVRAASDRYFVGPLVSDLGVRVHRHEELRQLFAPVLTRVAAATGDTAFLQVKSGADSVCMDRRLGTYPVKTLIVDVGSRRPIGIGAASIAMLAVSPREEAARLIEANAGRFAAYDVTPARVVKAVETARRLGYGGGSVVGVAGVTSIALPVVDRHGEAIAGIAVTAIDARMSVARREQVAKIIRAELKRVTPLLRV